MFGKVMSISDDMMWRYFELLSFRPLEEIAGFKDQVQAGANPRDIKFRLAEEMVERFHNRGAAAKARESFIARFQKGALPEDMPELELRCEDSAMALANLLKEAGLTQSTSEALRLIKQGAVRIDGDRVEDRQLQVEAGSVHVFQVGKRRFARVRLS
jgi:tyrosyl-tRNA synthetase